MAASLARLCPHFKGYIRAICGDASGRRIIERYTANPEIMSKNRDLAVQKRVLTLEKREALRLVQGASVID